MKVLAAISGGVDSAVAAQLAIDTYDEENVLGIYLGLWGGEAHGSSCSTADSTAAEQVAAELGIDLVKIDLTERFQAEIVDEYAHAAQNGLTQSPCVNCNKVFKFDVLYDYAKERNIPWIVTGHYAGTDDNSALVRGREDHDQSYFLWKVSRRQLEHVWFPLGMVSKERVRQYARRRKLSVADKPDSTDLCFDPKGLCKAAEPVVVVGEGVAPETTVQPGELTVGQRRGLPVTNTGQGPYYVTDVTPEMVTIGRKEDLMVESLQVTDRITHATEIPPVVLVQCSSQGPTVPCTILADKIYFGQPRRRIAPGQDVVFYDLETNTKVLGGATVVK